MHVVQILLSSRYEKEKRANMDDADHMGGGKGMG